MVLSVVCVDSHSLPVMMLLRCANGDEAGNGTGRRHPKPLLEPQDMNPTHVQLSAAPTGMKVLMALSFI